VGIEVRALCAASVVNLANLVIFVDKSKTIDDVVAIARVEGRKKLGCNVRIIDLVREAEGRFVVSVVSKYQRPDVGARSGIRAE
jgi:hypothetical protein